MKKSLYILLLLITLANAAEGQNCPPVAACNSGLTIELGNGGNFLLWPEDIFAGMVPDTCRPVITMQLEITDRNQNVIYPPADSILLECGDVGQDLIAVLHVSNGQDTNTCWGEITVRDNSGYCESFGPDTIPIRFNWYNYNRLPNGYMTVSLNGSPLEEYRDGLFIMKRSDILSGPNTLQLNDLGRGNQSIVSTLDVVFGLRMFFNRSYNPVRALVLDADLSSSMSVKDVIFIREYILGIRSQISERQYVTLPGSYRFDPDFDRYDFGFDPYVYTFDGDTVDQVDLNFEVFVIGDLDNTPDSLSDGRLQTRSAGEGILEFQDQWVEAGQEVEVPARVIMSDGTPVHGVQFELRTSDLANIYAIHDYSGNTWMEHGEKGLFRVNYASIDPVDEVGFRLLLTPKRSGYLSSFLSLSANYHQEVVPADIRSHGLRLRASLPISGQLRAWPNPVSDVLEVTVPEGDAGTLSLLSTDGRVLRNVTTGGSGQVRVQTSDLSPGLYLLRWQSGDRVEMMKLIRQ